MKKAQAAFLLSMLVSVGFGVAQAQNLEGNVDVDVDYDYDTELDGRLAGPIQRWGRSDPDALLTLARQVVDRLRATAVDATVHRVGEIIAPRHQSDLFDAGLGLRSVINGS